MCSSDLVKGESSSQGSAKNSEDVNAKPEVLKETKAQPTIMNSQRKSFAPNYRSINLFSPLINNVECFVCHNYGHVVANCRSKLFQSQTNRLYTERSTTPKYSGFFKGYCFSCNQFGHKAMD